MNKPFRAYSGDQPYIFVSYAHEDASVVYPEMKWLRDQGFNIWYDEGISPGTVWRTELADSIMGAGLFLFFITPRSANSGNCEKEVNFAIDHDTPVLTVHLEQTELPSGMELALSSNQGILKQDLPEQDYREKLLSSVGANMQRGIGASSAVPLNRDRKIAIAVAAVLGVLLAGYLAINFVLPDPPINISQADRPIRRFTIELPRNLVNAWREGRPVSFSADGQRLVFNGVIEGQWQLVSRSFNSHEVLPRTAWRRTPSYSRGWCEPARGPGSHWSPSGSPWGSPTRSRHGRSDSRRPGTARRRWEFPPASRTRS